MNKRTTALFEIIITNIEEQYPIPQFRQEVTCVKYKN